MSSQNQARVKNRAPAPIQISAEQILREAAERQEQHILDPIVKIHDAEEYQSHLRDRRKHFEDNIRYRREHVGNWVKYARFEEDNREYERARSVFERALEVDVRNPELWLRYAELEMRNEFVNRARNVLDRAVQLLPRIDFLWYKYVYMEEMVGDIPKCRAVFERWMEWMPDDNAWMSYARFEGRGGHMDQAKEIMRRYANTYPSSRSFMRFAKWAEFEAKDIELARTVYESSLVELEPEESRQARVFGRFAAFEERQGEYDRARVIYKHATKLFRLGQEPKKPAPGDEEEEDEGVPQWEQDKRDELYKAYIAFEKKRGDTAGIEDIVIAGQRAEYEKRVTADPTDYDAWFEYAKMEEENQAGRGNSTVGDGKVREVYERAIANVPPSFDDKQHWRRYIYLWIYYALYEEMTQRDLDRASKIYDACLDLIPHPKFSFAKIWINAANLHIRRKDLASARKLLGRAIGLCGKERLFSEYIALELALGEVDRCRSLYANYLKAMPHNCRAWSKYADLEKSVGETEVRMPSLVCLARFLVTDSALTLLVFSLLCTVRDVAPSTSWQ
jgi:crooked neck